MTTFETEDTTTSTSLSPKRKLRKGTHSCWECKRRKTRCVFLESDNGKCVGCQRRGTCCIDQNESNVEVETRESSTNGRLDRIEAMLATLLERQVETQEIPAIPATETGHASSVIGGEKRWVLSNTIRYVLSYIDPCY